MNIYLYLRHFPPYGDKLNEGLTKAVHGLASGLVNCGVKVTVLCEASASENSSFQTRDGYDIECFTQPIQSRPSFQISPGLKKYIHEKLNSNSLVILNGIFHASVYSISRLLKNHQVPYIIAPHDPYNPALFRKNSHLKWVFWYLLERRMLRQAKAVQVLDSRHGQFLKELGVNTPIVTVPNGFHPGDVYSEKSLQWQQKRTIKLYFLGRIDTYNKGLDILLNAFSQIVDIDDIHLTIQGPDWGNKQTLQTQAAQLSISEKVSFLDPDYDKSPSLLIQNYDIFCIPSRFEGFSLAALEAMLAGRVLLVSDIAGIAPHVQASGCGVLVAPEASAIKSGLIELLKRRSDWQEMGLSGRRYALEYLQWDKIASDTLQQYHKLINPNY